MGGAHGLGNHQHHHRHHVSGKTLRWAVVFTLSFMVIEFVFGWISNSLALLTDAAHMLADSGGLLLSLFAFWLSSRPSTPKMNFGYHRAEILGALLSGLIIWLVAGVLVYEAFQRLENPPEVNGRIVVWVAVMGLLVNIAIMRILHRAKSHNLNVRAAYLHVLGDFLGSIGALISGIVIWKTGFRLIDPIVTFLFSGLVLWSSWKLVSEAVSILMQATPSGLDWKKIRSDLNRIAEVEGVHDLHIWTVSSGKNALSVHLISKDGDRALGSAHEILHKTHGIHHTTIQVEHPERFNSECCFDCGDPSEPEAQL